MSNNAMRNFIFQDMAIKGTYFSTYKPSAPLLIAKQYPFSIQQLLAEMYTASAMLSAHLKISGRLSIQVRGKDTPLDYALVECRSEQQGATQPLFIKGLAKHQPIDNQPYCLSDLVGHDGHLVITLEPDDGQRYQGIVPLVQTTLAACLEDYFVQSEQLDTHIQLVQSQQTISGFMVQRLPENQLANQPLTTDWELIETLSRTLTNEELLTLPVEKILHRLFHEHDIQLFAGRSVTNVCDCSRERSGRAIASLGTTEINDILSEQENIVIDCHFCHTQYAFDKVDCHLLLSPNNLNKVDNSLH